MEKIKRLRFWLAKKLFTEDEKYLIKFAIDSRIDSIQMMKVTGKSLDQEYYDNDISDYKKIGKIFSSDLWN